MSNKKPKYESLCRLKELPRDVLTQIIYKLPVIDVINLAQCSKFFYSTTLPMLYRRVSYLQKLYKRRSYELFLLHMNTLVLEMIVSLLSQSQLDLLREMKNAQPRANMQQLLSQILSPQEAGEEQEIRRLRDITNMLDYVTGIIMEEGPDDTKKLQRLILFSKMLQIEIAGDAA